MDELKVDKSATIAARYINNTNCNVFLTGKAGTGKTTFLRSLITKTFKNTVVVAPTGIAAINAGGVTIHSQFQLPFGPFVPDPYFQAGGNMVNTPQTLVARLQMGSVKRKILRELELLVIDEVSMLRADILDAMDTVLRSVRRKKNTPFGGVQVLFIGDLMQLPPVVKNHEWNYLSNYYPSIFFFNAHVLKQQKPVFIELETIYRQSDIEFISILNNLRNNHLSNEDCDVLNQYVKVDFEPEDDEPFIFLTTHNRTADKINEEKLNKLEGREFEYKATLRGDFPESMFPIADKMLLKVGAQVMFLKNDYSGKQQFYNGKIGTVKSLENDNVVVSFTDGSADVDVERFLWENKKYVLNEENGEIEEKLKGSYLHFPLRLAWAITIHKSQGLTFERAIIDIEKAFAPGQMYVALSRLTSLNGLVLTNPISNLKVGNDVNVAAYLKHEKENQNPSGKLDEESSAFMVNTSISAFDFSMLVYEYKKLFSTFVKDGKKTKKQIDFEWMQDKLVTVEKLQKTGNGFIGEIQRISDEYDFKAHLISRVKAAFNYFEPILESLIKDFGLRLIELSDEKAVKSYISDLKDLLGLTVASLKRIERTLSCIDAIVNDKLHERSKEEVDTLLVEKNKLKPKNTSKEPTHKTTLKLLLEGKSKLDIAKERELGVSTIESHIVKNIELGELDGSDYLSEMKKNEIIKASTEKGIVGLSNLRIELGEEYTFFELKVGLGLMKLDKK